MAAFTVRCLTTMRLLDGLRSHLATTGLPEPAAVSISPSADAIEVQPAAPGSTEPAALIGSLLLWTHRLSLLSASWCRDPGGEAVHVVITGRLPGGCRIRLYKPIPYVAVWELVFLDPGTEESVSLDELYWLAGQLRHHAAAAA